MTTIKKSNKISFNTDINQVLNNIQFSRDIENGTKREEWIFIQKHNHMFINSYTVFSHGNDKKEFIEKQWGGLETDNALGINDVPLTEEVKEIAIDVLYHGFPPESIDMIVCFSKTDVIVGIGFEPVEAGGLTVLGEVNGRGGISATKFSAEKGHNVIDRLAKFGVVGEIKSSGSPDAFYIVVN